MRISDWSSDVCSSDLISEEVKNRYIAEAKAIRAFSYFRLVRLWGDIPMRLSPLVETDDFPLTPLKDVYQQIVTDLEWAIPSLWNRGEKPDGRRYKSKIGRASGRESVWQHV